MTKEELYAKLYLAARRFAKGFIASAGSFLIMILLEMIPYMKENLGSVITDPLFIIVATAFLLALQKFLQKYQPSQY